MSEIQVKRAIGKTKPIFYLIYGRTGISKELKPVHSLAQSLLIEFEDVNPNDLTPLLPPLRVIEH